MEDPKHSQTTEKVHHLLATGTETHWSLKIPKPSIEGISPTKALSLHL